jgi:hypothetical protein
MVQRQNSVAVRSRIAELLHFATAQQVHEGNDNAQQSE